MTRKEWDDLTATLLDRGYKVWRSCKYGDEDFDVFRMKRGKDGNKLYQLIFRFWGFEQFKEGAGYAVDFVVMPCIDGRMDAICSSLVNGFDNYIEFAEQFAKDYYEFVINHLKK